MLKNIQSTCRLFEEDDVVVAVCPEFNVSSFGDTSEDAVASLHEAMGLFFRECERMGTLDVVLEEAGDHPVATRRRQPLGSEMGASQAGWHKPAGGLRTSPHNVPVMHIRTNMTTAGMSRDRYFELLDKAK